jgi:hypothetical protein
MRNEHSRRTVLRTGAALAATGVGLGTLGTAAARGNEDKLNPGDFGRVWADGELWRTNVVRRLDEQARRDDEIYFLHDGEAPIVVSVPEQGSPFVSVPSPGEREWNGGKWTDYSAEVTNVAAFADAVEQDGPFSRSERVDDADYIEVQQGRPTNSAGEPFGPPAFFICPLNGRA